jgi:hypothetical protein
MTVGQSKLTFLVVSFGRPKNVSYSREKISFKERIFVVSQFIVSYLFKNENIILL